MKYVSGGIRPLRRLPVLENYYLPGQLEARIEAFVAHYNHLRYHESIDNLPPADVIGESLASCFPRGSLASVLDPPKKVIFLAPRSPSQRLRFSFQRLLFEFLNLIRN